MNFASLYNYYEHLVFEFINDKLVKLYPDKDEDFFLDVACYSLTRLPSRYIRHEIDMIYYLAAGEQEEMEQTVEKTVEEAARFISARMSQQKEG